MDDFLLKNCIALPGTDLEPWWVDELEVSGGVISRLVRRSPAKQLDAGALVVMPSMANAHTHMGDSALPDGATGLTLEEGFFRPNGYKYCELEARGESVLPDIEAHLSYMARSGTSLHADFREMGAAGAALLRKASTSSGVDSIILSQFKDAPFEMTELDLDRAPLPASAIAELEAMLKIADGFSESTMNDLTTPAWGEIRDITRSKGKLCAIHCLENAGYRELSLSRTGKGDLARAIELLEPDLIIHLTVADADEIALLAASGIPAVINPRANAVLGLPLPPIAALMEAGVTLLLGTDNGMLNSPNLLAELDFTYKVARSQYADPRFPDPAAILKMATCNAGLAFGDRFPGRIEEGLPANLCMLDFHAPHLRHSKNLLASIITRATPAEVLMTLHRGKVLYQNPGFDPST